MIPPLFLADNKIDNCLEKLTKGLEAACSSISFENLKRDIEKYGETEFVDLFLSKSEKNRYLTFKFDKRKTEWFAGRIAAKRAFEKISTHIHEKISCEWKKWQVEVGPTGRPYILNQDDIDLSISHSGGKAVAVAVKGGKCGVDIQKISHQIVKVEKRFVSITENDFKKRCQCLSSYSDEEFLTLIWSAKEALRKGSGHKPVIGFMEMVLSRVCEEKGNRLIFFFDCLRKNTKKNLFTTYQALCEDSVISVMVRKEEDNK